jgi:hypothetical protein
MPPAINIGELDPIRRFQAAAVQLGLKAFIQHGLQMNTAYTPKNMARTASNFTGVEYRTNRKGLIQAHNDLAKLLGKDPI